MSDLHDRLRTAFEEDGYDVGEVSTNRDQVRVALLEEGAEADRLRSIVTDTVGEENVLGLDVSTENVEGSDAVQTVVSFRDRS